MRIEYVTVPTEGVEPNTTMLAKYTCITYKPKEKSKGDEIVEMLDEIGGFDYCIEDFVSCDGVYEIIIYCGDRYTHDFIKENIYFPIKRGK